MNGGQYLNYSVPVGNVVVSLVSDLAFTSREIHAIAF